MSNYPHCSSIATSLSTSPFAVQSNLENLINRSRTHPHSHNNAQQQQHERSNSASSSTSKPHSRRSSNQAHLPSIDSLTQPHSQAGSQPLIQNQHQQQLHICPPSTIPEAAAEHPYGHRGQKEDDDTGGAAFLLEEEEIGSSGFSRPSRLRERERDGVSERERDGSNSGILRRAGITRPEGRGRDVSYGTLSAPLRDHSNAATAAAVRRNRSRDDSSGNSRSRSKARSPPRRVIRTYPEPGEDFSHSQDNGGAKGENDKMSTHDDGRSSVQHDGRERDRDRDRDSRGRDQKPRRLSQPVSPISITTPLLGLRSAGGGGGRRDGSEDTWSGGGNPLTLGLGVGVGMGMGNGGVGIGLDPAEELDAEDLELPLGDDGREETNDWFKALKVEIPILLRSGVPILFTQFAEWSLVLAAVISIGHLGTTDLAASSLASMTASVSSFSILQGLATALDTLLPAAWTSAEPSRVGLWTQRMSVVMLVSMIPMVILWWNIEGILLSLGQEKEVAYQAGRYLRYLSFGIPGYGGNVVVKKYLQCQNLMHIPTIVLFVVAPINLLLNWLLVWGPQSIRLGFVGGAVATAVSYTLIFMLNLGYALFWGPKEALYPFRLGHIFSKLGTVTSLGLAGTIMLSSEWWAWEACALAASLLGPVSLAAQSVLLSTCSTFYQIPASLGIASAVRVGNLLGAGRGWEAKWASRASLILSIVFAALNSAICMVFRKNWGYLFNNDPEVVQLVAAIMPYISLFQIADGVAATAGSILRSLGLHTTGALINLTSYYIIGLPFGLWLTFKPGFGEGLSGIWIGLSVALGYGSGLSLWLVWGADWERAVHRVRERLGLGGGEVKILGGERNFGGQVEEEEQEQE